MFNANDGMMPNQGAPPYEPETLIVPCIVCGKAALYFEWNLLGMACAEHAEATTQVGTVRSLAAALLKSLASDGVLDPGLHPETALIVQRLRPFLKD